MRLFKRKKREPVVEVYEGSAILQRFLLDCRISEAQQLGTLLGLPPMDADEAAREKAASDERIRRATPMVPIISLLTSALTTSILEYMATLSGGFLEDEDAEIFLELFNRVSLANAIGVVTALEDIGFIHYPYYLES